MAARRVSRCGFGLAVAMAALSAACHIPSTFTTARPVAPGKLVAGLGIEPVQVYTYQKNLPPPGPRELDYDRQLALLNSYPSGSPRDGEVRGGTPILLARFGVHAGCDVGARFSIGVVAADYKCLWYEKGILAISGDPQLGYVYTVDNDRPKYTGDGATLSLPVLASVDVTPWLRVTVSPGVSFASGHVYLLSNDAIQWPRLPGGHSGSRSSPVLDGTYARAGIGIEFHSRVFSIQPEVTLVHGVTTLEPVTSWHTGLAFLFGAIP